eukprot:644940-Pleurochrysis_carterae.AAC.2
MDRHHHQDEQSLRSARSEREGMVSAREREGGRATRVRGGRQHEEIVMLSLPLVSFVLCGRASGSLSLASLHSRPQMFAL